jgi:hypothetical protein
MGGRILRIELRRSVALLTALLIVAAGAFVIYASPEPDASWMDLVVRQRTLLVLLLPLALGAGAWQGIRERRSKVEELFGTTPRPRWWRILPTAGAMAIAAAAAYLAMLAAASGHLHHPGGYFPPSAGPLIVVGALAMVAAIWLGLAVGALLPSPLTAPMLVVAGFVILTLVPNLIPPQGAALTGRPGGYLLFPNLQVPDLAEGKAYTGTALHMLTGRANLTQALWLLALAAAGLALFAAARPATRIAALLPVVLGAVVAVAVMPGKLTAAWVDNPHATGLTCTTDRPRICVARAQSHLLDELREPARQALSILDSKLPAAPVTVTVQIDERADDTRPPVDTLLIRLELHASAAMLTSGSLLATMLGGAGVPLCLSLAGDEPGGPVPEPVVRYLAARLAAALWLLDGEPQQGIGSGTGPETALATQALDTLRALPADEQRARVGALRDAERTCAAGDRLDLLTGSGSLSGSGSEGTR